MEKILIAYYSRRGENYVNGNIVNLPIGNTEVVAQKIEKLTDGDMFRIDTIKNYPTDYNECTRIAKSELQKDVRPRLVDKVDDMELYDTVFLGYPNWWGTMPMAVHTFLESYDFAGKTIIPFCTHEGSGMGQSVSDIRRLCPSATVYEGVPIRGSLVEDSDKEIGKLVMLMQKK